jgi:hypothetical protein
VSTRIDQPPIRISDPDGGPEDLILVGSDLLVGEIYLGILEGEDKVVAGVILTAEQCRILVKQLTEAIERIG